MKPVTASKIRVFPVPVVPEEQPVEPDPGELAAEVDRLRAENAVLRERLAAVHAIALEREGTIEDLRHALQMLPSVWAEKLEEGGDASEERTADPSAERASAETPVDQAELLFAEMATLRARLERKQLEAEQEILEQERRRLLADIEWTRSWQRSRGREQAGA
jgi:hypothetical protein